LSADNNVVFVVGPFMKSFNIKILFEAVNVTLRLLTIFTKLKTIPISLADNAGNCIVIAVTPAVVGLIIVVCERGNVKTKVVSVFTYTTSYGLNLVLINIFELKLQLLENVLTPVIVCAVVLSTKLLST
jgi:hypothetical protein